MKRRTLFVGLAAALSTIVASASAQTASSVLVLFGNATGPGTRITGVPGNLTGSLTISFRGDPQTGCAGQGLCGYSGTVVVRPGSGVEVVVAKALSHRHATYEVALSLPGGSVGAVTASHVVRAGGGTCGDAGHPLVSLQATVTHDIVRLPFLAPGGTLIGTRCAGPLDGDLGGLGPQLELPVSELIKGNRTLDMGGTWSFAAGGFAGTMTSNLKLVLHKPFRQSASTAPKFPRAVKTRRVRQVTEVLTITRGQGELNLGLRSDPASCEFLDSCGISGSETATIQPQGAIGSLTVFGPATRPYRDFLAALGIDRQGNPRGLAVSGTVGWTGGGTVSSNLTQGTPCASLGPAAGGAVLITGLGTRFALAYTAAPLRTRCPGPALAPGATLASGTIALRQFGPGSVILRLSGRGPLSDDGYAIAQQTSLSLTLHRGRIRQQTFLTPSG